MPKNAPPELSVIFWNIWFLSQVNPERLQELCKRFDNLIDEYQPDVFGLNEVLISRKTGQSRLLQHLESRGYKTYFAPFGPKTETHLTGSALVCRHEPTTVQFPELGPDATAEWKGYKGHTTKLILARIPVAGAGTITVAVNHLAHLVPYNWRAHVKHHRSLRKITSAPDILSGTIIGGDFNQFKFMPRMSGISDLYHRATGTFFNPTWRLMGKPFSILRANYDNIMWSKNGRLSLQQFSVLPRYPSDHAPLFGRFAVSKDGK